MARSLASFSKAIMPVNVGEEADVPPIDLGTPLNQMRKRSPCAATSGIAFRLLMQAVEVESLPFTYASFPNNKHQSKLAC